LFFEQKFEKQGTDWTDGLLIASGNEVVNLDALKIDRALILQVSVAPPGLVLILWCFPGVPFGHPRLAYKPAQHLTVAPPGAESVIDPIFYNP
jgi:hypothetical protein